MVAAIGIVVCVYIFVRLIGDLFREEIHPAARLLFGAAALVALWGLYSVVTTSEDVGRLLAPAAESPIPRATGDSFP